jgi:putative restriction endonuclease
MHNIKTMNTWKEDIIKALKLLGGEAHLNEIYEVVEDIRPKGKLTKDWRNTLRTEIYHHSSDAKPYLGKEDLFYLVEGKGKGIWGLNNFSGKGIVIDLAKDDIEFPEGKKKLRQHVARERNPKIIRLAKRKFIQENGRLYCEICGFDFEVEYGELGKGFIEGHHLKPVSELKKKEKTKIKDIVMVCSNCHKMLHRKRPWLKKKQLKKLKNTMHNKV